MNFQSLKTMIDNLVQTYHCPSCQSGVDDTSVEVVGTAGSNINVEVVCPGCGKHSIVRAQVFSLEIPASQISNKNIEELKNKLGHIHGYKDKIDDIQKILEQSKVNKDAIKDEQIINLNKVLKGKNFNITDFFGENK